MLAEILTPARAREIFAIAQAEAKSHGVADLELILGASAESLTRFANNAIHQNVAERSISISIRPQEDQRTARASTNRLDPDSIRAATRDAIAILRAQDADPHLLPLAEPSAVEPVARWFAATAACSPDARARAVAEAIAIAEAASQTAAGIFSTAESLEMLLNSNGVEVAHPETMAVFSITAMAGDSSGWAKQSATDHTALDISGLARSASTKATRSANPRELDPGDYTVVLEPAAVLDLVGQMFPDFSGTAMEDQRSFLNERMGTDLFGGNISITDDVRHPLTSGPPFDGEGIPRRTLSLVEKGTPRDLAWCRATAARNSAQATGHGFPLPNEVGEMPANIVIAGGAASLDDMIRSTARGVYVTRLWYIREVDPYEKKMTGMTRDGTFLIENGELAGGVRNFRFNQSIIDLLKNTELLGPSLRASGEETFDMVVPAIKAHSFRFSEVTRF